MADTKSESRTDEGHGLYSGEHPAHAQDQTHDRIDAEILADREWVFATFVRWSAWTLVLVFLILAFLALTQT
jgi:hypothetical protein